MPRRRSHAEEAPSRPHRGSCPDRLPGRPDQARGQLAGTPSVAGPPGWACNRSGQSRRRRSALRTSSRPWWPRGRWLRRPRRHAPGSGLARRRRTAPSLAAPAGAAGPQRAARPGSNRPDRRLGSVASKADGLARVVAGSAYLANCGVGVHSAGQDQDAAQLRHGSKAPLGPAGRIGRSPSTGGVRPLTSWRGSATPRSSRAPGDISHLWYAIDGTRRDSGRYHRPAGFLASVMHDG